MQTVWTGLEMNFIHRQEELWTIERKSGSFIIWKCAERGRCTELDRGVKMKDGTPLPVCVTCPLLAQCRVAESGTKQPPFNSGIGTRLKAIIEEKVGAMPCGECKKEVLLLNKQMATEVMATADSLADRIVERAQAKAPKWWQRWGATLAPGLAKGRVLEWIKEACS